jgi:uncharacterized protein YndB with AHSA1/START domain
MIPILIALIVIGVLFFVILVGRPDDFRVTRSATIAAPPATVFAQVNDFHNWDAWSPWAKLDPACKNTFDGAPAGKGAIFAWDGNNKVGAGRMTVTDSAPAEVIRINLEFLRPFKATNTAEFTFQPQGGQTLVTWNMFGKNNLMSKAFGLFVNCDNMIGKDFEKGLASLKSVAEAANK